MATVITTPIEFTNLVPGKIVSLVDLDSRLLGQLRKNDWQVQSDLWGEGGALDAKAVFLEATAKLTLQVALAAYTPTGHRINILAAGTSGFFQIPYESDGASTYRLLARWNDVPVVTAGSSVGTDGQPHYTKKVEAIGRILTPSLVTQDGSGDLTFTLTSELLQGEKWASASDTRPCTVWYERDPGGGPYAAGIGNVFPINLTHDGAGAYTATIASDLKLGNPAADLTADRFRLLLHGMTVEKVGTDDPLSSLTEYVELSRIVAGVISNTDARLINDVGDWIAAFNVEHDSATGHHLDVTADTIELQALVDAGDTPLLWLNNQAGTRILELNSELNSGGSATATLAFANVDLGSANKARIAVEAGIGNVPDLEITKVANVHARVLFDGKIVHNPLKTAVVFALNAENAVDEDLEIENIGAGDLHLVIKGGEIQSAGGGTIQMTNTGHHMLAFTSGAGNAFEVDAVGGCDAESFDAADGGYLARPVTHGTGYAYAAGEELTLRQDFAPHMGGWSEADPNTVHMFAGIVTPLGVSPHTTATSLIIRHPIEVFNRLNDDVSIGLTLEQVDLDQFWSAASTVSLQIKRFKRDRTGTVGTVVTLPAGTSGAWETVSSTAIAHTVDQTYNYWLEATLNADTAIGNAKIGAIVVHFSKDTVE